MKLDPVARMIGLPLVQTAALAFSFSSGGQAAETTLLLCQGSIRNTARVYQEGDNLKMRLYDRDDRLVWFNSPARSETNPEVITYTNVLGENTIRITANRNDPSLCSIQVGNQPLERGTVVK